MEHFCRNAALKTTSMKRQTFNRVGKGYTQKHPSQQMLRGLSSHLSSPRFKIYIETYKRMSNTQTQFRKKEPS